MEEIKTFGKIELELLVPDARLIRQEDPVLEDHIRQYRKTITHLQGLLQHILTLKEELNQSANATKSLTTSLLEKCGKSEDAEVAKDCFLFNQAVSESCAVQAPFSLISKFNRDLSFNVINPLKKHIKFASKIETRLALRKRLIVDLLLSERELVGDEEKVYESFAEKEAALGRGERKKKTAGTLQRLNQSLLEWFLIFRYHQQDLEDSLVQTLKLLIYEYHSGTAQKLHQTLPTTVEFRPMIEMTPEHLEAHITALSLLGTNRVTEEPPDAHQSMNLLLSGKALGGLEEPQPAQPHVTVDPINLSLLLAQGFETLRAEKALIESNNDLQSAMDSLTGGARPVEHSGWASVLSTAESPQSETPEDGRRQTEDGRPEDGGRRPEDGGRRPGRIPKSIELVKHFRSLREVSKKSPMAESSKKTIGGNRLLFVDSDDEISSERQLPCSYESKESSSSDQNSPCHAEVEGL